MFELFLDIEYVQAYIDDLLVMSCSPFEKHLECLKKVHLQLNDVGLQTWLGYTNPKLYANKQTKQSDTHVHMLYND